jgi:hypothetical protein
MKNRLECVWRAFEFETLPHFAAFCRVCECGRISVVFKNENLPERPIRISFPFLAEPSWPLKKVLPVTDLHLHWLGACWTIASHAFRGFRADFPALSSCSNGRIIFSRFTLLQYVPDRLQTGTLLYRPCNYTLKLNKDISLSPQMFPLQRAQCSSQGSSPSLPCVPECAARVCSVNNFEIVCSSIVRPYLHSLKTCTSVHG